MNNRIYCSSGVMLGRLNNCDYRILIENAGKLNCDGFEFIFYQIFNEIADEIAQALISTGLAVPVTHADKDIGIYLSCSREGYKERAFEAFENNCRFAARIGSSKIVLHLWGGEPSDGFIGNNIACLPQLYETAARYSLELLIENVPCAVQDPLTHWETIASLYPYARFIYDTRFSAFHGLHDEFLASGFFEDGRIDHVHVSDYVGPCRSFSSLRPIPHLGCGIAGLDGLLRKIAAVYNGGITLESPEIHASGTDTDIINRDLAYIKERTR